MRKGIERASRLFLRQTGEIDDTTPDLSIYEEKANKGANSGYCGLTSGGLVDPSDMGTGTPSSSNFLRGDGAWTAITEGKKAVCVVTFCSSDWTPTATGLDIVEIMLPHLGNGSAGGRSVTWNLRRLTFRLRTYGSTASTINIQKSTGTGAFSGSDMMSSDLSLSASTNETYTSTFSTGTADSGDKLKLSITGIGTGAVGWMVMLMLEEN